MRLLSITVSLLASALALSATTYTVIGAGGGDYTTIQGCADVAMAGDTCLVYSGTYAGATLPSSGSAGYRITFLADTGGTQPIINANLNVNNKSYITISGFYFSAASVTTPSKLATGSYIEVLNNTFNNTGSGITSLAADHVLISGNTFTSALKQDVINQWGSYWVIRNNVAQNIVDTGDVHLDFWQTWCITNYTTAQYTLLEGNIYTDISGTNTHFALFHQTSGGTCSAGVAKVNYVLRYNKVRNVQGDYIMWDDHDMGGEEFARVAVYNNTAGDIYAGSPASWQTYPTRIDSATDTKLVINNLYYQSMYYSSSRVGYPTDVPVYTSLVYYPGQTVTTAEPLSTCISSGGCIINQNPNFVNYAGNNFALQVGSPAIDTGGKLTTVAVADTGSGTSLVVDAAFPFQNGWAGVDADWIRVGATNTVQIASIDYDTNTITLTDAGTTASGSEFFTGGSYNLKTAVGDTNLLWPTLLTPGLTRAATNWSVRISGAAENIDDITNGCAFDILTKWAGLP